MPRVSSWNCTERKGPTVNFEIKSDWVDTACSTDTVMRHTMARLTIKVQGQSVTAVQNLDTHRYRDSIIVPLFAIADWLVDNWWHLFHEPADTRNRREDFAERHNMAFASNGFLLPKLSFASYSDLVHVVATPWEPEHGRISFIKSLDAYVARKELQSEFKRLIERVVMRLEKQNVQSEEVSSLSETWTAIQGLDSKEREFCRVAALFGMDPFDVDDDVAAEMTRFWDRFEPSIREDALAVADARSLQELGDWIESAIGKLSSRKVNGFWHEFRDSMPRRRRRQLPWTQGYELARAVRKTLDLANEPFDFSTVECPVYYDELKFKRHPFERHIDGVVAAGQPACIAMPQRLESNRRFLQARTLGDFLRPGKWQFGILNSLNNERQAFTRAFAAELLAPASALEPYFGSPPDDEEVVGLSRRFKVSPMVISHQIENHRSQGYQPFQ